VGILEIKLKTVERLIDDSTAKIGCEFSELLYTEQFEFNSGKLYGVLGERGEGGWGISLILSGKVAIESERVCIDKRLYTPGEYVNEGWYVGNAYHRSKPFHEKSIEKQIECALRTSKLNYITSDIADIFSLSPERFGSKLSYLSWERWRASAAIGFAGGKQIFTYPWFDSAYLTDFVLQGAFAHYMKRLREAGAIILVPSANRCLLECISDEIIELKNPRFHNQKYVIEYMSKF
jgi:hypothetical protein